MLWQHEAFLGLVSMQSEFLAGFKKIVCEITDR